MAHVGQFWKQNKHSITFEQAIQSSLGSFILGMKRKGIYITDAVMFKYHSYVYCY